MVAKAWHSEVRKEPQTQTLSSSLPTMTNLSNALKLHFQQPARHSFRHVQHCGRLQLCSTDLCSVAAFAKFQMHVRPGRFEQASRVLPDVANTMQLPVLLSSIMLHDCEPAHLTEMGSPDSQGQSEALVRVTAQLFDDIQSVIESKQLAPVLRTQACPPDDGPSSAALR